MAFGSYGEKADSFQLARKEALRDRPTERGFRMQIVHFRSTDRSDARFLACRE